MELISDIVKTFTSPANISTDIKKLQQLLPLQAIQDRMLKHKLKSYISSLQGTRRSHDIATLKNVETSMHD